MIEKHLKVIGMLANINNMVENSYLDDIFAVVGVALFLLAFLLPILYATFLAIRVRPVMPERLRFVAAVASLSYGSILFFIVVISMPLQLYFLFVAPPLQEAGLPYGSWLVVAGQLLWGYSFLVLPLVLVVVSVVISKYLVHRWPRIVVALRS